VAREPHLSDLAILGHRALGQVAPLVGSHHDASPRQASGEGGSDERDSKPGQVPHGHGDHITRVAWRQCADPLYTSRMRSLSFLLVTLAACAGTQEEAIKPIEGMPPPPPRQTVSGDVSFDVPAIEIKGVLLEPKALDRPGMPLVEAKKKTTVEKQRALVQSTRDVIAKQAQAAILATMLYLESKASDKAKEKTLLTEARQVLRDVAQVAGDKSVDEITLRLLGSYEILLEDYPAAEKAWQTLIEKDPKSNELAYHRAWLAYALLKQFKNAEALAALGPDKPDEKHPELAYVGAWARWRTGDNAGAWQSISAATRGWGSNTLREELEREVLMFAGRARVSVEPATALITGVLAKGKLQQYQLIARLALTAYGGTGRWNEAVAALDKAVEVAGDAVPPSDRPVIRYSQADYTIRLDTPDVAAKYAKQAIEALGPCGAECNKADTVQRVFHMARLFHILYATANDSRYYQPAHQLYGLTIPMLPDAASRAQAEKDVKILETTLKNLKVGTGTHDKNALGTLLGYHNPEIEACYDLALQSNPKLGGTVTLQLESDATGVIKGVATEPRAGLADVSAVAGCVADRAKQWKLTKRGMKGTTRIKMTYTLSLKK
jgi:tetratricopeptide (TPR) repeat protein